MRPGTPASRLVDRGARGAATGHRGGRSGPPAVGGSRSPRRCSHGGPRTPRPGRESARSTPATHRRVRRCPSPRRSDSPFRSSAAAFRPGARAHCGGGTQLSPRGREPASRLGEKSLRASRVRVAGAARSRRSRPCTRRPSLSIARTFGSTRQPPGRPPDSARRPAAEGRSDTSSRSVVHAAVPEGRAPQPRVAARGSRRRRAWRSTARLCVRAPASRRPFRHVPPPVRERRGRRRSPTAAEGSRRSAR